MWILVVVAAFVSLLSGLLGLGVVHAHGKKITLDISALSPDPEEPRTRLYRVFATYADDKEPVDDVVIYLQGQRRQGGEILERVRPVHLNSPGFYAAQVTYPRYGAWEVSFEIEGANQGAASLVEEILPAALPRKAQGNEAGSQRSIFTVSLAFGWRDIANLAMRWMHSLAAAVWFGLSGIIVVAFRFLSGEGRDRFLAKLSPLFPVAAALSLALLAATGFYNAVYNSPLRPPGILSLEIMARIPYGLAYMATTALKVFTVAIGAVFALRMAVLLRGVKSPIEKDPAQRQGSLLVLATVNLSLGLVMLLPVAVMVYLHNLSHLAVLVGGGQR